MRAANGKTCLLLVVSLLLFAAVSYASDNVSGKTFYTAVNIWYENPTRIESTNYHRGFMLPLGTEVTIENVSQGAIRFSTKDGTMYKLLFVDKWAKAGTSISQLFNHCFSQKDPKGEDGAFKSLTSEEQKSVVAGKIVTGMSKTAVLMAYGYPPEHKTPSLKEDTWIYWESRYRTIAVTFNKGRVMEPEDEPEKRKTGSISECIKACKENTSRTPEQCFDACNK